VYPDAKPNKAHIRLAELEKEGKLHAVITQNIDGLHQKAGSVNVCELHGSIYRNFCMECGAAYDIDAITHNVDIPLCGCGGIIKPNVVLYGEGLDSEVIGKSIRYISNADVLIIGGTSMMITYTVKLIDFYMGNKLVLINKSETHIDGRANLLIRGSIGEVLSMV